MDSEDDLDIPSSKPAVVLDDSDDDLLPLAAATAKRPPAPPPQKTAAGAATLPKNQTKPKMTAANQKANGTTSETDTGGSQMFADTTTKTDPSKVYKEGFLLKQQPSWPYSNQKRYCVLKNCRLFYFDSQDSMKEGKPQGMVDLKNAKFIDTVSDAKVSNSFGIFVQGDNGEGGNKKGRTYIFSVLHVYELGSWKAVIKAAIGYDEEEGETHWFTKMVDGDY